MMDRQLKILIVEDGDEYLDNLSRFVPGPEYIQAHSGAQAIELLQAHRVQLIYLDMRFDRIPERQLLGDLDEVTRDLNGDAIRARRHLQNNQGLFILEALRGAGWDHLPVILAYDFSAERRRYDHLKKIHPSLRWVPDAVTPEEIRRQIEEAVS